MIFPQCTQNNRLNAIFATEKITRIMHSCKPIRKILTVVILILSLTLSTKLYATVAVPDVAATDVAGVETVKAGMALFKANCASCHGVDKKLVGPALTGVWDRWESEEKLISWIQNSTKFLATGDAYANKLFNDYNKSVMSAFPQLTPEQIKSILVYVKNPGVATPAAVTPAGATTAASSNGSSNWFIWILVSFLLLLAILLWSITSKLDKAIKEDNGEVVEEISIEKKIFSKKTFKVLMLIGSILLVFNIFNGAIDLGRSQGYAPEQPIKFSHALHVGQNKIECQYCHSSVEKSKHASIPGTQICMNCHKAVSEGPKYGKDEIAKIYSYSAGTLNNLSLPKHLKI